MDADLIRSRLEAEIERAKVACIGEPFVTGEDDCTLWVASIYETVFGIDPAADYRGKYRNRLEAANLLGREGVAGHVIRTAARMGWRKIEPAAAAIGDLALIKPVVGDELGVAIFDGSFFVGRIDGGYSGHDHAATRRVWSVV